MSVGMILGSSSGIVVCFAAKGWTRIAYVGHTTREICSEVTAVNKFHAQDDVSVVGTGLFTLRDHANGSERRRTEQAFNQWQRKVMQSVRRWLDDWTIKGNGAQTE